MNQILTEHCRQNYYLTNYWIKYQTLVQIVEKRRQSNPTFMSVLYIAVDKFVYLGSTLSMKVHIDDEVNARIAKATAAFSRMHDTVCNRRGISTKNKMSVCKADVLTKCKKNA